MPLIRVSTAVAFLIVALCGYSYARGPGATSVKTEALTASIRDNPGSYKPSYSSRTGYVPARSSRGGGGAVIVTTGRNRRTSGGGWRYGK